MKKSYTILDSIRDSIKGRNNQTDIFVIDSTRQIEVACKAAGIEVPKSLTLSGKKKKRLPLWLDFMMLGFLLISNLPLIFKEVLVIRKDKIKKDKRINWKKTFHHHFIKNPHGATFFQYYFRNNLDFQDIYTETLKTVLYAESTAKKLFITKYICNFKYHLVLNYDR